jgi:hypothetical protein
VNALPESTKAYFIKLGEGGAWESSCLSEGTIRFGYHATPQDLCVQGQWEKVRAFWAQQRGNEGTATNDARQIRTFFEASEDDIFVTFSKGYLWWCRPSGMPVFHSAKDGSRLRQTVNGWRNASIGGEPLLVSRLSGKLTKTQMYQGTICDVDERAYLLRRINDQQTLEVLEAEATEQVLTKQILAMIRLLTPKDFELMVELIFSRSGWQRQSSTGGSQKTLDLDLLLPTTRSVFHLGSLRTNTAQFEEYAASSHQQSHLHVLCVARASGSSGTVVSQWGRTSSAPGVGCRSAAWLKDRLIAGTSKMDARADLGVAK